MREIPEEVAQQQGVPRDLDSGAKGPYTFPSPRRRRAAGWVYLAGAALAAVLAVPLGAGMFGVAGFLVTVSLYHFLSAWNLEVTDRSALAAAGRAVGFAVGHAGAALGFRGWRARPVWNVMLYSAEEPPRRRALVRVDAVNGVVLEVAEQGL
jgi:hypothetical protein